MEILRIHTEYEKLIAFLNDRTTWPESIAIARTHDEPLVATDVVMLLTELKQHFNVEVLEPEAHAKVVAANQIVKIKGGKWAKKALLNPRNPSDETSH